MKGVVGDTVVGSCDVHQSYPSPCPSPPADECRPTPTEGRGDGALNRCAFPVKNGAHEREKLSATAFPLPLWERDRVRGATEDCLEQHAHPAREVVAGGVADWHDLGIAEREIDIARHLRR